MSFAKNTSVMLLIVSICTIFGAVGCDSDPVSPGVQPEIINGTQSFEFQVTAVSNFTGSWSYTWDNASTFAAVDHSTVLSGGTATLVIADASGTQVYSRSLTEDGSFSTAVGTGGDWSITVTLDHATGDLNFRVQEGT